jgi:hypothetical protein
VLNNSNHDVQAENEKDECPSRDSLSLRNNGVCIIARGKQEHDKARKRQLRQSNCRGRKHAMHVATSSRNGIEVKRDLRNPKFRKEM